DAAAKAPRMVDRQVLQHAPTGRRARHVRLLDAEGVHERHRIPGNRPRRVAVLGLVAVAGPAVVEGNAAVALGELGDLEFPGVEQPHKPRDEDEGRSRATLLHVKRDVSNVHARHGVYSESFNISATSTARPSRALRTPALITARLRVAQWPSVSGVPPSRTQWANSSSSSRIGSLVSSDIARTVVSPRLRWRS